MQRPLTEVRRGCDIPFIVAPLGCTPAPGPALGRLGQLARASSPEVRPRPAEPFADGRVPRAGALSAAADVARRKGQLGSDPTLQGTGD